MAFVETLNARTLDMEECCLIRDGKYWDLASVLTEDVVRDPDTLSDAGNRNTLRLVLRDGYEIRIVFIQRMGMPTHFNGYVTIPSSAPFACDVLATSDYDGLQRTARLSTVELTCAHGTKIGWNHLHHGDADLGEWESVQPDTVISGPVQVFEEAVAVVNDLRRYEGRRQRWEKAWQVQVFKEELMQKAWHPTRVMAWVEAGLDM